jgi:hypothetical protein
MRNEKALIGLLRGMVDLLADEAGRNPDFAARLDALLSVLPARTAPSKKNAKAEAEALPDVHAELAARSEAEFQLWLNGQPVNLLRALIRTHDLDSTRRTVKWKDAEKLAAFIAEGLRARLARGSSFIGRGPGLNS